MANFKLMTLKISNIPGESSVMSYIEKRYERFLDYAKYHSDKAGIPDEANDLLNEVLLNTMQKDSELLDKLYSAKKGQYRELDYFVLRMIKVNAHSTTSPFRYKNRPIPVISKVKLERLKLVEQDQDETDLAETVLKKFRLINWVYVGLDLTEFERAVFDHKFINNESFTEWPGPETYRLLNLTYNQVLGTIQNVLYFYDLTRLKPKRQCTNRQAELAEAFVKSHKIKKIKQTSIK